MQSLKRKWQEREHYLRAMVKRSQRAVMLAEQNLQQAREGFARVNAALMDHITKEPIDTDAKPKRKSPLQPRWRASNLTR